jgi:MEMO1 family protein
MDLSTAALPPLRAGLDCFPMRNGGRELYCLRDRADAEAQPLLVSQAAVLLASLLDGERSLGAVRAAFTLRTGAPISEREIADFVRRLDEANLLESEAYRARQARQRAEFKAAIVRAAIHAGGAYPGEPDELQAFLDGLYAHEDGPGVRPGPSSGRGARGLIAPHIDLHRGGPTYAWTYQALAECRPADVYVLLGTYHLPMGSTLAATRKAYATPLGPAPVDHDFLDALESAYPGDLYADELGHRSEHSIEFQALYLRSLGLVGAERGATVVPILCGSIQQWVAPSDSPLSSPEVRAALGALRAAVAARGGRICLVAGADLAHVGPRFGDRQLVRGTFREAVERGDREMLELVCRGDAEGFYAQVMRDADARRICGLSPIYYLLSLIGPGSGRLLKYSQWVDASGQGAVTYAGVLFEE